jgi:hypothetical protein
VISPRRAHWSPRFRLEVSIPRSPLVAGLDLEANGIRKGDVFRVAALLGVRYGPEGARR